MFGWVGRTLAGRRIRELEELSDKQWLDYARLMRDCDLKSHKITLLRGLNDAKDQELGELDAEIERLKNVKQQHHDVRDPETGRFIKRTDTRSIPADNKFSGDSLRGSLSYEPPRH